MCTIASFGAAEHDLHLTAARVAFRLADTAPLTEQERVGLLALLRQALKPYEEARRA